MAPRWLAVFGCLLLGSMGLTACGGGGKSTGTSGAATGGGGGNVTVYTSLPFDPSLDIDEDCFLFIRNCGPVGYPGAAEVVNMRPPAKLIEKGIMALPTIGDGRQSGTSESPSILNASPEAAIGGNLSILRTGDRVRLDINRRRLISRVRHQRVRHRRFRHRSERPPRHVLRS